MSENVFRPKIPFNIEILILTTDIVKRLGEVKTKDVYEQNSTVFHKDGLFSTEIFGPVGSKERLERFGYISLGTDIIHPLVYRHLCKLESLYKGIIEGTKYAIWDDEEKNFKPATKADGETGFSFFIKHFDEIKFRETNSEIRKKRIEFIKKYKAKDVLVDKWLVLPAGMRDRQVLPNGKVLEDEINNLYRDLLTISNTAKKFGSEALGSKFIDPIKARLEKKVTEIYEYIENILSGKEGFIQGKWVKRTVMYGTRNVITAIPIKIKVNHQPNRPRFDQTVIGLYQFTKGITPIAIYHIRTKFLNNVFDPESNNAYLYNPKTFEKELVEVSNKTRSQWVTDDGLEKSINKLIQEDIQKAPIVVDGKYMFLVYDDGNVVEIIDDVRLMPVGYDKKYIRPMTYMELVYLSIFDIADNYPGFVTRYPITGLGSVYPTKFYLKTTIEGREVLYKGLHQPQPIKLYEYPRFDSKPFLSLSPNVAFLGRLGADFDGDKMSATIVYEDESRKELMEFLNSTKFYLDPTGKLVYSNSNDISDLALKMFTE